MTDINAPRLSRIGKKSRGLVNRVTIAVDSVGGQLAAAALFNVNQATVSRWEEQGRIPFKWRILVPDVMEQHPLFNAATDRQPLDPRLKV